MQQNKDIGTSWWESRSPLPDFPVWLFKDI